MAYRATLVSKDPLNYFLQTSDEGPHLRVSDVILRTNLNPKDVFSGLIRLGTNSAWSHSALIYLVNDPTQGYDNTFIVEAMTSGIRVASWRNEVFPFEQFTVGIRRFPLDWYAEASFEKHNTDDPEDVQGITYLRHVRGFALDQINNLYDQNAIYELIALYAERFSKRFFLNVPELATTAANLAHLFAQWDAQDETRTSVMRFICSGLVQYSLFAALRRRIINALASTDPKDHDAAMSNLSNMQRIIVHPDLDNVIATYVQQVQSGKLDINAPVPIDVTDLLKTTVPSDFNNSDKLQWRYVIRMGWVWQIDSAPDGYKPQSDDETAVLQLMSPEPRSVQPQTA